MKESKERVASRRDGLRDPYERCTVSPGERTAAAKGYGRGRGGERWMSMVRRLVLCMYRRDEA